MTDLTNERLDQLERDLDERLRYYAAMDPSLEALTTMETRSILALVRMARRALELERELAGTKQLLGMFESEARAKGLAVDVMLDAMNEESP